MPSWNAYVTRRIPEPGLDLLRKAGIRFDMGTTGPSRTTSSARP